MRNNLNNSNQKKNKAIVSIVIIALVLIVRVTGGNTMGLAPVESFLRQMLYPVQSASSSTSNGLVDFFRGLGDYKRVREENVALKTELGRLETFNSELLQYKVENEQLRNLLGVEQLNTDLTMANAEVIGRSIKDWYSAVTINKGYAAGIRENMPVVNYSGLIGRVTSVTQSTAEVILLTDSRYGAVTVRTTETGYPGVLTGSKDGAGGMEMIQIPSTANIMEGYEVVTSGLGDMIYKNIKIGRIREIVNSGDGLMKKAIIEPYADFNNLRFVGVILKQEVLPVLPQEGAQ